MKVDILDYLHKIFLRLKGGVLFAFILIISLASFASNLAFGQGPVAVVETPVRVLFDGTSKSFVATQNTVEGALRQGGINLSEYDITEPARGSLLAGQQTEIKVTRALPVLISDGGQEQLVFSAYTKPADIFKQLDIPVYPEDKVDANLIMDPVDEKAVGQKINITRAPTFTVYVDDNSKIVRSWGKTVKEVLDGKVNMGAKDIVEPGLNTSPVGIDAIKITRVNVAEIEETVSIPFNTITNNDYNLYQGQSSVTRQGANGQKKQQVRVTYHNGVEVGRTVIGSTVISNPVTKIVSRGVKPYNAGAWWDTLVAAGNMWGVNPVDMYNVMNCESHGNPYAGYSYIGLFQYAPATWAGASSAYPGGVYSGAAITDGKAQIYVTAWKVSRQGWAAWGCKP